MSRKPIQVPDEVKTKVEDLKGSLHKKTEYEVIEELLFYHGKKSTHMVVHSSVRSEFNEVKNKLRIRDDEQLIKLLLHHFQSSPTLGKETFDLYLSIR